MPHRSEGIGAGVNGGEGWHAMALFYQSETVRVARSPVSTCHKNFTK